MTTIVQPPLFCESIYDALRAAVAALGGPKIVGAMLWPAKPIEDARTSLLDALNPERRGKLDPDQILLILRRAKESGYHGAMEFIATECGYRCEAVDPLDERAQLQRDFIAAVEASKRIAARLEKTCGDIGPRLAA